MYKYNLIGNVYKDEYVVGNSIFDFNNTYRENPFNIQPTTYNTFGHYANSYEYNINNLNTESYLSTLINNRTIYCSDISKYENEEDYKSRHKLFKENIITIHYWNRYEEFDTIETDIELRDGETIKIQDKDYKVLYKFNKELVRHELYINYEVKIEVDEELKKLCEDKLIEINNRINEYNKMIDDCTVVIDERFENYVKSNDKDKPTSPPIKVVYDEGTWFGKIKKWLERK